MPRTEQRCGNQQAQCGGDFFYELRNMAVPFAILFTKSAIEQLLKKKSLLGLAKAPKQSKKTNNKQKQRMKGGGCGACAASHPMSYGGSLEAKREAIDAKFAQLMGEFQQMIEKA